MVQERFYLDRDDVEFLRELRRESNLLNKSRQTIAHNRPPEGSKTTYMVEVPPEGIPALEGDKPGSVQCDVTRIIQEAGEPKLSTSGQKLTVYNHTESEIPEGRTLVDRDAFGTWWVVVGGGGVQIVRFQINQAFPSTGTSENGVVLATIIGRSCLGTEAQTTGTGTGTGTGTDEEIEIHDGIGCMLDEENLEGLQGYAVQMRVAGECRWEVFSLCCPASST